MNEMEIKLSDEGNINVTFENIQKIKDGWIYLKECNF